MKKIYILLAFVTVLMASCTKRDILYAPDNGNDYIRNREKGIVAYVDYATGNYIVDTYNGYAVIELQGGIAPRENDEEYAYFSNRGFQNTYNYTADYFTNIRVVQSWLTWQDASYLLDQVSGRY